LSLVSILAPAANTDKISPWRTEAAAVAITVAFAATAAIIGIIVTASIAKAGGLAATVVAGGCCSLAHTARQWQLFRGSSATEQGRWWRLRQHRCRVGGGSLAAGADLHRCCRCRSTTSAPPPPPPPLYRCRHCRAIIMVRTTECII
jgi:hypothetical protein